MTVSYVDSNRRDDLRSAALFVIDDERQSTGYDKRIRGSAGVPDVVRVFDEVLAMFPLESEIGNGIKSAEELPCWRAVLCAMGPVWSLWPQYSASPHRLLSTQEWSTLQAAVQECVTRHGLWLEEIEYPVNVVGNERPVRVHSWSEVKQLDRALLTAAALTDDSGRRIDLDTEGEPMVRRVSLPRRTAA
jgi:hypothetical protein